MLQNSPFSGRSRQQYFFFESNSFLELLSVARQPTGAKLSDQAKGYADFAERHEGAITGIVWSPDGRLIYALAWHEDGLTLLVRLNPETAMAETLIKDLDARPWLNPLSVSADGSRLYVALAGERMQIFAVPPT